MIGYEKIGNNLKHTLSIINKSISSGFGLEVHSVSSAFSRDDHDNDSSNEDYLQIGHRTYMELLDVFTGILLYLFLFALVVIKVFMFSITIELLMNIQILIVI